VSKHDVIYDYDKLLEIGLRSSHRLNLAGADAQDCAAGFALKALCTPAILAGVDANESFVSTAARNFAYDFIRAERRRRMLSEAVVASAASSLQANVLPQSTFTCREPLRELLHKERFDRVRRAIDELQPLPRELFVRHYLGDESLETLANYTSKSVEATRRSIRRAAEHVRRKLARQGYGAEEFVLSYGSLY
jgi:RNA polymerase sigma factor (sigma-70 family)